MTAASPTTRSRPIKVVVAKVGLDGHDVGAKVICRALMDAGMEVVYTGLRQSPQAVARTVQQEAPDVLGISVLSGAHLPLVTKVIAALREAGAGDVPVVVGGAIPRRDEAALAALGVSAVFPTSSPLDGVVERVGELARGRPSS